MKAWLIALALCAAAAAHADPLPAPISLPGQTTGSQDLPAPTKVTEFKKA